MNPANAVTLRISARRTTRPIRVIAHVAVIRGVHIHCTGKRC